MAALPEREARTLDRYQLFGVIASGGMASVHFGRLLGAHGFARTVAIKRLHPQFARDPEFSSMLLDEARLAARIRHPNVVTTFDSVQADGELFLVMEYIAGESLAGLLRQVRRQRGEVPLAVGSAIVAGALAGLHAAHEATDEVGAPLQIVHRDVSPQNILVGEDGIARVLDFGIARAAGRSQVSREGQLKGKLSYMAPEQLRGQTPTRRADIYAAAVVLWEVLTGRRLFDGESDAAVFGRILEGVIQPPSAFVDVPRGVDEVVLKGLQGDPERRYATALEMAAALEAVLPPASPRQVGAWIEQTAGETLEARAQILAEIESSQRRPPVAPPSPVDVGQAREEPAPVRAFELRPSRSLGDRRIAPRAPSMPTLTRTVGNVAPPQAPMLVTAVPVAAPPRRRFGARIGGAFALAAGTAVLAALAGQRCGARPESATMEAAAEARGAAAAQSLAVEAEAAAAAAEAHGAAAEPSPAVEAAAEARGAAAASSLAVKAEAAAAAAEARGAAAEPSPATSRSAAAAQAVAGTSPTPRAAAPPKQAPRAVASSAGVSRAAASASARATAAPRRPAAPRSPCVPPYYVDENGIRRIKRACR